MNSTIENHLAARRLEAKPAGDEEVVALWEKAAAAYLDAINLSVRYQTRFLLAYDAGRMAASALVRSAGYRPKGREGHHFVALEVARSLATVPELRDGFRQVDELRKQRHALQYEAYDDVDEAAAERAIQLATRVLALGAEHLVTTRPSLRARIQAPGPASDAG